MDHKKYKWFYTKSGKLVVGGKSAESNDSLLRNLKETRREHILMHTKAPGSPFCAILAPVKDVNAGDLNECAIFTGCFSRAWKEKQKDTSVDMFHLSQINKTSGMKTGTWSVKGKIQQYTVELNLAITTQDGILRAVPSITPNKADIIAYALPGNIDKAQAVIQTKVMAIKKLPAEQLLAALPAGGVTFKKNG
ncbi:MAG: NFACT RNA binding domain-containing protein [Candidatus Pacearchaeota archaeon]